MNTITLYDPLLAKFCLVKQCPPNVGYYANAYDVKQLGNPIRVALATNRLTHDFRRYTGKHLRWLSLQHEDGEYFLYTVHS